ncbi:hypothetical protein BC332_32960 [Capsicum chinense]|nr:hypothetical protein BC332_32960 [Capsicum chinense]
MTVKYLLTLLTPKSVNLYGFPWAFMFVHPWLVPNDQQLKMPFFLTLRSMQILSDPKVFDRIKIEFFGATTITRKIILEGELVIVDDDSGSGSGSGVAVGDNDAPLKVFKIINHYDYDHTGYIDFARFSECSAYKCQDCKAKYDGVISAINTLIASVKEIPSKRGVIPSKRISYPYTPLQIKPEVSRNEEFLINIIKGFSIPTDLPWHLINEVYIPINYGDKFHWMLAVIVLNDRHIQVYDTMSRKSSSGLLCEIQKLSKILPIYLEMSCFLEQKVRTDWSMIEAYRDKMGNPFNVQYVKGIAQQTVGSLDCDLLVAAYVEYLSDGLQVPNDGLDAGLLCKSYAALLWKYGETKAQKPYTRDIKDPRRP